ncbi:MAG: CotH kinase family protein, partial [Lachnospiraceae bacterium]|nr:CotH kinase family protein [Lachnospiraceae bacterium]
MSTDKHIDKTILGFVCLVIAVTLVFMLIDTTAFTSDAKSMKYESTIFDTSYVHKIDIVMDDWDSFIETCENEEYSYCTVVVDGKQYKNIAIRAKGNTSLSSVSAMDSERYSFKLEFDHYDEGTTLDGLDKLCLNNLIQDNTMMKDYLVYSLMDDMGVDAPLCSYAYITVNGNDWGLYLAVESVEDSFLTRNYGENYGDLYKPDSTGFGGGRGNGKDFNMDSETLEKLRNGNTDADNLQELRDLDTDTDDPEQFEQFKEFMEQQSFPQRENGGMFGGFGGGMGSDDVKLKYTDDDPDSYSNIFDNAKTDVTTQDKNRLISALKNLSEETDLETTVDVDEVISYFVVHNFVVNGDSYTGSMIHNYYLYEEEGKLSMIPWDYNLAFGSFQSADASE